MNKLNQQTSELLWNKLIQINQQIHDLEKNESEHIDIDDVELCMSEVIMEKYSETNSFDLIGDEMIYELYDVIRYISQTEIKEIPTLQKFNKVMDNLTEKEWDFYIDCIMNY